MLQRLSNHRNQFNQKAPLRCFSSSEKSQPLSVDLSKTIGHQKGPYKITLTPDASILYALGVGCSSEQLSDYSDLRYTYEGHQDFQALPSNYLTLCHKIDLLSFPGLPPFHPMQLVHGEESLQINRPPEIGVTYEVTEKIVDC